MFVGRDVTTSITLFNKVQIGNGGTYLRTVLDSVFWADVKQKNVLKTGLASMDSVYIQVQLESLDNYVTPKEYAKLEDKVGKFTFSTQDIIVKGVIDDVMTDTTQQALGTFLNTLKSKYDNTVTITTIDSNLFGSKMMQHIQLSCK